MARLNIDIRSVTPTSTQRASILSLDAPHFLGMQLLTVIPVETKSCLEAQSASTELALPIGPAFEPFPLEENRTVVGTLTMVYDHHRPKFLERLIEAQHQAEDKVLAATHVHMDHHNCLEVIIMKGRSSEVRRIADRILSLRRVKHGKLVLTTRGKEL